MGVAPRPINCEPSSIDPRPLPRSLKWVARAENELVNDWTQRRAHQSPTPDSHSQAHKNDAGGKKDSTLISNNNDALTAVEQRSRHKKMLGAVRVPVACISVPLPANRSSGIVFRPESGQPLPSHIPVGLEYYEALRSAWHRSDGKPAMHVPDRADSKDLDDSLILDCIDDMVGDKFDPLVPLDHMIDLLTVEWEEEGLYELERRRVEQNL